MGTDKIEKRLPEEILSYIDEEAVQSGITRQEAVSKLVHAVVANRNDHETMQLRQEVKNLSRLLAMKEEENAYLRSELSAVHKGLSKMADTLASGYNMKEIGQQIHPVEEKITELSGAYKELKETLESALHPSYERHIPLIMIGILAGLLILYLIIMKI